MNTATHEMNGKGAKLAPSNNDVELALIDPSPTQPRRTFDEVALKELADDIKTHGVLQDVLVRPSPTKKGRFELVFGERRCRASKLAGLKTIPAKVRNLSDAEVIEIQIVENAKRSDIHPLEEADAYEALHKKHGYSVEEIAAKVAKSTATIYARLKLCTLVEDARKAFLDGKLLDAGKALLLARIPHEDLQKKALAEITKVDSWRREPMSLREAQEIVRKKFMLRLADAPFDRADGKLVAGVPACSGCPKRTGNQRELFSDIEAKDDLCTDPKCFKSKCDADWAKRAETAKAKGQDVLTEKKAKSLWAYGGLSHNAPFVDLDARSYVNGKERSNRSLLGKADVAVTIARDPDGKAHELVDRKTFEKLTKETTSKASSKPTAAEKRWAEQQEADRKARERAAKKRAADLVEIVAKAEKRQPTDAFWRLLALEIARAFDYDTVDVLERRALIVGDNAGEDLEKALRGAVAKMNGNQARGLVVELLVNTGYRADESIAAFRTLYGVGKKGGRK